MAVLWLYNICTGRSYHLWCSIIALLALLSGCTPSHTVRWYCSLPSLTPQCLCCHRWYAIMLHTIEPPVVRWQQGHMLNNYPSSFSAFSLSLAWWLQWHELMTDRSSGLLYTCDQTMEGQNNVAHTPQDFSYFVTNSFGQVGCDKLTVTKWPWDATKRLCDEMTCNLKSLTSTTRCSLSPKIYQTHCAIICW